MHDTSILSTLLYMYALCTSMWKAVRYIYIIPISAEVLILLPLSPLYLSQAPTTGPPEAGFPMGAIIGIAVGAGVAILVALVVIIVCVCWCRHRSSARAEFKPSQAGPFMVVRRWEGPGDHVDNTNRSGSFIGSRGGSLRSSISSIGSFLRRSSRRGSRRGKKENGENLMDDKGPAVMHVTAL